MREVIARLGMARGATTPVRALLRRMPQGTALPILTGPLRGKRWILRAGNYSCWLGTYELRKQQLFAAELSGANVVYDIGAHAGFYSMLAAVATAPTGRVYAFEPFQTNVGHLRRHTTINGLSIEVIEAAVADWDGTAAFQAGEDSYTGKLQGSGQDIEVTTVDAFRTRQGADCPDLIKIDVEGAELLVLKGAAETLSTCKPTIFVAVHGPDVGRDCIEFLRAFDYEPTPILGDAIEPASEYLFRPASDTKRRPHGRHQGVSTS